MTTAEKTPDRTPYHHGDLRRQLLDEARRQLESVGPEGVSMREIARAIGVSHNAPYRHFPNSETFLAGLAEIGFGELRDALLAAKSGADDLQIERLGRAYIDFARGNPALYRLMFGSFVQMERQPTLKMASSAAFRVLEESFERPPPQAKAAAFAAWSLTHGLVELLGENFGKDMPPKEREVIIAYALTVFRLGFQATKTHAK